MEEEAAAGYSMYDRLKQRSSKRTDQSPMTSKTLELIREKTKKRSASTQVFDIALFGFDLYFDFLGKIS